MQNDNPVARKTSGAGLPRELRLEDSQMGGAARDMASLRTSGSGEPGHPLLLPGPALDQIALRAQWLAAGKRRVGVPVPSPLCFLFSGSPWRALGHGGREGKS